MFCIIVSKIKLSSHYLQHFIHFVVILLRSYNYMCIYYNSLLMFYSIYFTNYYINNVLFVLLNTLQCLLRSFEYII